MNMEEEVDTDSNKVPDLEITQESASKSDAIFNLEKSDKEKSEGEEEDNEEEEVDEELQEKLSDDIQTLKEELDKIVVSTPTPEESKSEEVFDPDDFPPSYKDNLPKELLVLQYAENFRRQYVHLYRDRKPLFLNPVNECSVEKFVCTTIRPTQLPYKELYSWDGAAEFVTDYLDFERLSPAFELPNRMLSPTNVLKRQKGNCFEYSTLLCSLLLAAGYDAYVVSGYATKETCLADETRQVCPLLKKKEEIKSEEKKKEITRYTVKPPKDLRSKFILKMEARKVAEEKAAEEKRKYEEEQRMLELEKPPPDPLHGLRIHAWVLVLSGKREVPESFFIEAFTGLSHPVSSSNYLGIESLWNNYNYWVNMQDCSEGVGGMTYDLGDCTKWEFMFPGLDKPILQIPEVDEADLLLDDDDEDKDKDVEKHLDMPPSWVEPFQISQRDFELRCPQGKKVKIYKRSKLEKFARYLMKDGLVSRLSVYENRELTDLFMIKEFYEHRADKLYSKIHNHRTGWVTEVFHEGRAFHLKEHQYKASDPGPENERTMFFFNEARVDGLVKRMETPLEMTEYYSGRDDFMYYKHTTFGRRPKSLTSLDDTRLVLPRPISRMVVKFTRNPDKPANQDISEMAFMCSEDKVQLTYHRDQANIAASFRHYVKPANWDEKGAILTWNPEMHATFQVDPFSKSGKQVTLYELLMSLLKIEGKFREQVRESEAEVCDVLAEREREEKISELLVSLYDTERNDKAKEGRRELEQRILEEKMRKEEMEVDYLAPFLAHIWDPPKISRQQAYKLKEDCLADLKQRLIDKANLIQARFEKETQELQKKQTWYQQNQISMSKDDEEDYLNYCSEAMFRIHILEVRLNRHKDTAPVKYKELEKKLRNDPRLAEYF